MRAQQQQQASLDAQTVAAMNASAARTSADLQAEQARMATDQAARDAAISSATEQAKAQIAAKRDAYAKAVEESCVKTRPARAADAQGSARAYAAYLARAAPQAKAIVANCKLTLTDTGDVQVERNSGGWRVHHVQKQGVKCPGGMPKGVTEPDVYNILMTVSGAFGEDPLAADSQYDADNRTCADSDRLVGLDTQVTNKNTDGIKALLAWKGAPAP